MANEATLTGNPESDVVYFTVADGTAIAKGTLMVISADPRTAVAHSAVAEAWAGVAVEEKEANDGQVKMGCMRKGVVDMVAVDTITVGDVVELSATANKVQSLETCSLVSRLNGVVGIALESADADEQIPVLLG